MNRKIGRGAVTIVARKLCRVATVEIIWKNNEIAASTKVFGESF